IKAAVEESGRTYAELSGRGNDLQAWQEGKFDVIGVQIQAGGVGISLVRARYCVYYSMGYSLGDYEQSLARVHRPGQKQNVTYIHLVATGTVDEKVYKALQKRKQVIEDLLEGVK
ncbi:MAG: helicase-related protein, partial [Dehalococcoidia bacterium]